MKKYINTILIVSYLIAAGCSDDFLDKKPDKSLVVPTTLDDLQSLLDNADRVMNIVPAIGMVASDDAFTTDNAWQGLFTATERNSYVWKDNIYEGEACADWNIPYQQVFYANVVLEGLEKIEPTSANEVHWKSIKGSALFFRAHAFHQLVEIFSMPVGESSGLGIPIRLTADVNAPVNRASREVTFDQIINDLTDALPLLPGNSSYKTRPTVVAAKALLSRVYLFMGEYEQAESWASESLSENNYLLDYNTLSATATRPVPRMNDEILFHGQMITYGYTVFSTTYVDTLLYDSYEEDDLRKQIFFRLRSPNRYTFKANYTGTSTLFGGIANDEVYLIRAECRARLRNISGALEDLNALLEKRWTAGAFVPVDETNPEILLARILEERRKELLFRATRWSDLKRLNQDQRFAVTLHRTLNGTDHSLLPNDVRYAFPIPDQEIQTSGIGQNPR
jgi:tetratricopeptide (TPR) repeat protein